MSGRSNVIFWMEQHGLEPKDEVVDRIFAAAKSSDRLLEEDEIRELAGPPKPSAAGRPRSSGTRRRG